MILNFIHWLDFYKKYETLFKLDLYLEFVFIEPGFSGKAAIDLNR